jgi:hypothetical protein
MAVSFPDWWTENPITAKLPKIEDVNISLFSPLLTGVRCVYWLDTDEQTQQVLFSDAEAYLRIVRLGGEVDLENRRNIHRVQFAAISNSRNLSWDILAFVQQVLYAFDDTSRVLMPDGATKVPMKFRGERLGPLLDPQQIRDARLVAVTVELETPIPKGLPKIGQELGL